MKKYLALLLILTCSILLPACGQAASTVTPAIAPAKPSTSIAPSPDSIPSAAPVINPDMKKALGEAPYNVAADGNANILVGGQAVELVQAADVKTNDGLASDIKTGKDKDGNRFVYVENYGWVKEIALVNGAELPFGYDIQHLAALNTMRALQYSENPTIAPDAVLPKYSVNFPQDNFFLGLQSLYEDKNGHSNFTKFTKATQPFTEPVIMKMISPEGQEFEVLMVTEKNPTSANPNQLINMFYFMGKKKFDIYTKDIPIKDIPAVTSSRGQIAPILAPPATIDGVTINWNPLARFDYEKDPEVVAMQKRGELLALFSPQEQADMEKIIAFWNGDGPGLGKIKSPSGIEYDVLGVLIDHIPEKFALHPLLLGFEGWTYSPGK